MPALEETQRRSHVAHVHATNNLSGARMSSYMSSKMGDYVKGFITDSQKQTDTLATSTACKNYLAAKITAQAAIVAFMDKEGIDLMVYPAANQPAFPIGNPPLGWFGFQMLSSPTGLPRGITRSKRSNVRSRSSIWHWRLQNTTPRMRSCCVT